MTIKACETEYLSSWLCTWLACDSNDNTTHAQTRKTWTFGFIIRFVLLLTQTRLHNSGSRVHGADGGLGLVTLWMKLNAGGFKVWDRVICGISVEWGDLLCYQGQSHRYSGECDRKSGGWKEKWGSIFFLSFVKAWERGMTWSEKEILVEEWRTVQLETLTLNLHRYLLQAGSEYSRWWQCSVTFL